MSDQPRLRPVPDDKPKKRGVSWDDIIALKSLLDRDRAEHSGARANPYQIADLANFAPGTLPQGVRGMAQDSSLTVSYTQMQAAYQPLGDQGGPLQWLGFPYLAELSTRPEYRRLVEGFAREMTRKWIKVISKGDADKAERVEAMEEALKKYNVQAHFKWAIETDGYFGRSQLYIDVGNADDAEEQRLPLRNARQKIPLKGLKRFVQVEPMWCYPANYNAADPLKEDFYVPQMWYVQGKEVHTSRLLTFVGRPVPDLLKPAYGFSGLSMTQISRPYVDNWLRTRQSVSDLIHSFSTPVLMTNLMAHLGDAIGENSELVKRIMLWNVLRDNRDTLVVDKEAEDFKNISAPLGGLDHLQAQSLEQIAAIAGMPLVVFLGITPSGLNASTEGEIVAWFNYVRAFQEFLVGPQLNRVFDVIQMSEFGEVDPDITYEFESMREMDEAQVAAIRKQEADTAMVYVDGGIIAPEEERERLARAENSLWSNIDPSVMPEPPVQPGMEGGEGEQDGLPGQEPSTESGETPAPPAKSPANQNLSGPARDVVTSTRRIAHDEFREADHPRGNPDNAGQFSSGGGTAAGSAGGAQPAASRQPAAAPPKPASAPAAKPAAAGRQASAPASVAGAKGVRTQANGEPLPPHIAALKIPPGWKDVRFNPDPNANLLVSGKDDKGRPTGIYAASYEAAQAASKFSRVETLAKAMPDIEAKNAAAMNSSDPRTREAAECLDLIMTMGLRPGSETDTGAKVQAYGATTLQGQHVKATKDGVRLQFTGKKGVALDLLVPDPALGKRLLARAKAAGPSGQLFGISEGTLLAHVKDVAGPQFKTKDFRTHLGTKLAGEMVQSMPVPKDAKEYKQAVMAVAKNSSQRLGNTPVICLQSYVNPTVFAPWAHLAGQAA